MEIKGKFEYSHPFLMNLSKKQDSLILGQKDARIREASFGQNLFFIKNSLSLGSTLLFTSPTHQLLARRPPSAFRTPFTRLSDRYLHLTISWSYPPGYDPTFTDFGDSHIRSLTKPLLPAIGGKIKHNLFPVSSLTLFNPGDKGSNLSVKVCPSPGPRSKFVTPMILKSRASVPTKETVPIRRPDSPTFSIENCLSRYFPIPTFPKRRPPGAEMKHSAPQIGSTAFRLQEKKHKLTSPAKRTAIIDFFINNFLCLRMFMFCTTLSDLFT